MTPKLKLREAERKASLSAIENFSMPGMRRTKTSTQMILAPTTQATPLIHVMIHPRVSLSMAMIVAARVPAAARGIRISFARKDADAVVAKIEVGVCLEEELGAQRK
jgi:hypothetical protein